MTRLLQAMAGARHGGAEAFFERLAVALQGAGEEQRIVIRRDAERSARLRQAGLEPIELAFGGFLDFATKPALAREIAAFRPRVVLSWMSRATDHCPRGDFVHVARLGGYYDLRHYRACDHLIGNTRALTAWLVGQGWPEARVHYLPNFAEIAVVAPASRASLDTPEDATVALALGRLHRNKGFDVLLSALAQAKGLYLWIAGEGDLDAELKRQAVTLGVASRVRFLGWRRDVAALLGACDMVVCPSRSEPLGNTILEAWAARVPVVAAASSGPTELIIDGKTGLLVAIEDADALAEAMTRLATDGALAADLGAAGYEAFAARFTAARVTESYREFFAMVAR